jgi:hypothetical protein
VGGVARCVAGRRRRAVRDREFITDRVNKVPLVLVFLGVYYLLFTAAAFLGKPRRVAEIFRAPDLHAALFFAFFILPDPPTAPAKYPGQVICGVLVAVVSFAVFQWIGAAYYLLAGVLAVNVWEAWRRAHSRQAHAVEKALAASVRRLMPRRSGRLA